MARFIHHYETNSEFTSAYNGTGYTEPWVSYTVENEQSNYNKEMGTAYVVFDEGGTGSTRTAFLTYQQANDMADGYWSTYGGEKPFKLILEGPITGWNLNFEYSNCYSVTLPEGTEEVGVSVFEVDCTTPEGKTAFEINLPMSIRTLGDGFVHGDGKSNVYVIINYPGTTVQFSNLNLWCWYYSLSSVIVRCSDGNIDNPSSGCGE